MKIRIVILIMLIGLEFKAFAQTKKVNFSADVTSGYGHLTVTFTNTSVGSFNYFIWNAFDKTVRYNDDRNFVYTFKLPGIYAIRLTAMSTSGTSYVEKKYQYIRVYPTQLPAYELTANDVTIDVNGYITACNISDFNTSTYHEGNLKIPSTINGKTIKGIADDNTGIFYDKGIIKLNLPNTLEYIGTKAFLRNYIQSITIPNGVTTIGEQAFCNNQAHGINIPPSVQRIEHSAFLSQHMYGRLDMLGSGSDGQFVTKGTLTFTDANGNPDVQSSQLEYIGPLAFAESGLRGYNTGIIDGITVEGLYIPPSVEEIGSNAFYNNNIKALAFTDGSATCPESNLKILREEALHNNYESINKPVVIPASIERIEEEALNNLIIDDGNGSIRFEDNSNLYYVGVRAYSGNSNIHTPTILPTQAAANNTPGLWMNMNNNTLISPQTDGNYKLSWGDTRELQAAYAVSFVDYDGTSLKSDTVICGNSATPPSDPTRAGYTFTGWDTDVDSIVQYLTVTAQYTQNTVTNYTIVFKDYDGTVLSTQTVAENSSANPPPTPTRTGYTFTGWDTNFSNVTSNLTVTAQYSIQQFTVTFKDYDGTELKTDIVDYGNSATPPTAPTRTDYTFTGWDTDFSSITCNLAIIALYQQSLSISDEYSSHKISIFPNPTTGSIRIYQQEGTLTDAEITIYSITGNLVYSNLSYNGGLINLTSSNKGIYLISIKCYMNIYQLKLIKQ
jgi:uncharacterized repeat protein (TIGR02543 family)